MQFINELEKKAPKREDINKKQELGRVRETKRKEYICYGQNAKLEKTRIV